MKYRHGDVIIEKTSQRPSGALQTNLILAYGEVTGHKHQISKGKAQLYQESEGLLLVVESETVELTHEEHATIQIPEGTYKVLIQREYQPEGWRYVQD